MHTYTFRYLQICMYASMYNIYIYIYIYIIYIYIYIKHTYIHKYVHTCTYIYGRIGRFIYK